MRNGSKEPLRLTAWVVETPFVLAGGGGTNRLPPGGAPTLTVEFRYWGRLAGPDAAER